MRISFILFLCLFFNNTFSQKFEWAIAGEHIHLSWEYSAIDSENNLIAGGYASQLTMMKGEPALFDFTGKNVVKRIYGKEYIIVSYSQEGKLNWSLSLNPTYSVLRGITTGKNGVIYLLLHVNPATQKYYEEEEDDEIPQRSDQTGFIPELSHGEKFKAGLNIIKLDKSGRFMTASGCNFVSDEIHEFKSIPAGGFIASGRSGSKVICTNPLLKFNKAGGDYILMMNDTGKVIWGDAISYHKETCCSYVTEQLRTAFDKNGNIYLSGTYMNGGTFGNSVVKKSSLIDEKDPKKKNVEEAYVASYSKTGKLLWVITSEVQARVHSLAVSDKYIAIGTRSHNTGKVFGHKFDSTNKKSNVITFFDKKGKWKNNICADGTTTDMNFNKEGELVVLGENKYASKTKLYYEKDSIQKRQSVFLATFTVKGDLNNLKTANLPLETSNDITRFYIGSDNNFYLCGQIFASLPIDLFIYDKAFKAGKLYGGSPFILRWNVQ